MGRTSCEDTEITVVDLPGAYSLTAYSLEERVARDYLIQERPDVLVHVVDAANLDRNLYLAVQFLELGLPLVIALNMIDVAESRGLSLDAEALSRKLGVPVVTTVARSHKGLELLKQAVVETAEKNLEWRPKKFSYGLDIDSRLKEMEELIQAQGFGSGLYPPRWLALKCLEGDTQITDLMKDEGGDLGQTLLDKADELDRHLARTLDETPEGLIADYRYGFITSVTKEVITRKQDLRLHTSDRIDRVLINRLLGPIFLFVVLYSIYEFTFSLSETPVDWMMSFFAWLGATVEGILPPGPLSSLIVSGVIDGVGGGVGVRTPDRLHVFRHRRAGGQRVHGPDRLYHGPGAAHLRAPRVLGPGPDRGRRGGRGLRRAGGHGRPDPARPQGEAGHHPGHAHDELRGQAAGLRRAHRRLFSAATKPPCSFC